MVSFNLRQWKEGKEGEKEGVRLIPGGRCQTNSGPNSGLYPYRFHPSAVENRRSLAFGDSHAKVPL